jgi:hypothetical protein
VPRHARLAQAVSRGSGGSQVAGLVAGLAVSALAYRVLGRVFPAPALPPVPAPGHNGMSPAQSGRPEPPPRTAFWRTNFAGEQVNLFAGPACVAGLTAGCLLSGRRTAAALALAVGGVGLLDDLTGNAESRGLGGHLRALSRGRVTTGAVKVVGLSGAASLIARSNRRGDAGSPGGFVDVAVDSALIAGTANLVNLFDLRPGRATKAVAVITGLMAITTVPTTAGAVVGALGGTVRADMGERAMLGDCGANAAGAVLAAGFTAAPRAGRLLALAGVAALTLASERVSFSRVIDNATWLRRLDRWGRRSGG